MSGTPTPVNMNDRMEVAARIVWLTRNDTRGATERTMREPWNDPYDRNNAINDVSTALQAFEKAKELMPVSVRRDDLQSLYLLAVNNTAQTWRGEHPGILDRIETALQAVKP